MTVMSKIRAAGGFVCFATIGSIPLGYYKDGKRMTNEEYFEAMKLRVEGKLYKTGLRMSNAGWEIKPPHYSMEGDLYKPVNSRFVSFILRAVKYIVYPVIFKNKTNEWVVSVKSVGERHAIHSIVNRSLWRCVKLFFINIPRYVNRSRR